MLDTVSSRESKGNLSEVFDKPGKNYSKPDHTEDFEFDYPEQLAMKRGASQDLKARKGKSAAEILVGMEEKRMALMEKVLNSENSNANENKIKQDDSEDNMLYFKTLMPHVAKIDPSHKLRFRNEINRTVFNYAYPDENWQNMSNLDTSKSYVGPQDTVARKKRRTREQIDDDGKYFICLLLIDIYTYF